MKILYNSENLNILKLLSKFAEINISENIYEDVYLDIYDCCIFDANKVSIIKLNKIKDYLPNIKYIGIVSETEISKYENIFDSLILKPIHEQFIIYQIKSLCKKIKQDSGILDCLILEIDKVFNLLYLHYSKDTVIVGSWLCKLAQVCRYCDMNQYLEMLDYTKKLYISSEKIFNINLDSSFILNQSTHLKCITLLLNTLLHISIYSNVTINLTEYYLETSDILCLESMLLSDILEKIIQTYKLRVEINEITIRFYFFS